MYRPPVKSAVIIARLCCAAVIVLVGTWHFIPTFHTYGWTVGLYGAAIFVGLMGVWHEGYATPKRENRESGNALFLILICVALFAALTAAMNQGSRTSTGMVTDQQARLYATEILQYANTVKQAVQMLLLRGCSETEINFANDVWKFESGTPVPSNANAPEDGSCDVFKPAGAGLTAQNFPQAVLAPQYVVPGGFVASLVKVEGVGTEAPELALWMSQVDSKVCDNISRLLGITSAGEIAPIDSNENWAGYNGSFNNLNFSIYGNESQLLIGKAAFCAKKWPNATGIYIHVLIAR